MSQSVEPLRGKDAAAAEFIERWQQNFERDYDLSKTENQPALVEALSEIAKFVATENKSATIQLQLGSDGVTGLSVQTQPKQKE